MPTMNCLFCGFRFRKLLMNGDALPDLAPIVCEACGEVALVEHGQMRKMTNAEFEALKTSDAWKDLIAPARELILRFKRARQEN